MQAVGKYAVLAGLILVAIGLLLWLAGDKLNWLGRLPGDIRIEKENYKVFIPITTMLLISAVLTILMWIIRKITG